MLIIKCECFMKYEDVEKAQEQLEKLYGEKVVLLPTGFDLAKEKVLFLCDGRACEKCNPDNCKHTCDIRHAKNFKMLSDIFIEQE